MSESKGLYIIHGINFGIFAGLIAFTCGYTLKELKSHYKKNDGKIWLEGLKQLEFPNTCRGMAVEVKVKGTYLYYLIIRDPFTFTDDEYCTLAHECIHLVQFRLKDVLDRDREFECEAYLHTHLMSQCLKALRGPQD